MSLSHFSAVAAQPPDAAFTLFRTSKYITIYPILEFVKLSLEPLWRRKPFRHMWWFRVSAAQRNVGSICFQAAGPMMPIRYHQNQYEVPCKSSAQTIGVLQVLPGIATPQ